jgi:hypothetical protein
MKIDQMRWTAEKGWEPRSPGRLADSAQLVLAFGSTAIIKDKYNLKELKKAYPRAHLLGCSTSGEIHDIDVTDDSLSAVAIHFESTRIAGAQIDLDKFSSSYDAGRELGTQLDFSGLNHVFVLSNGLEINASDLVKGLSEALPPEITVTGGLAGDGARFKETIAFWNDLSEKRTVAALGLYGDRLKVGFGSLGGWDPFGPERLITRSNGNVLYELDGKSALELYKRYLGEHAKGLPATGLLYPLSIRAKEDTAGLVRTILAVDEENQCMTFAGDIPEGMYARLMKANFERLIDGATGAAKISYQAIGSIEPDLAILISCVGRKMVLKQRVEEEIESVRELLGDRTKLTGFYSYGEISPFTPGADCALHNQTMTITTLLEI